MLSFINTFNLVIFVLFTVLYSYQIGYAGVALLKRKAKKHPAPKRLHRYAVVIAARNESNVIGQLIQSIRNQTYPSELVDVYVVADNCTDNTADVARMAGATVYERFNKRLVGKGYALDFIFKILETSHKDKGYEGYFVFDADNLLDEHYIEEMNKTFDQGYRVLTSYRNSKNYDTNWISAGYSLWFLRESKYLNNPRMMLHTSCAISGTGFLISSDIIREQNGWKYHLLTEDIEFSIDHVIQGETIGYCGGAMLYDEQPTTFEQSWNQRLRWSKGFYQVMRKYGVSLFRSIFHKDKHVFASYDMFMTIMPAVFVSLLSVVVNAGFLFLALFSLDSIPQMIPTTIWSICSLFINFYVFIYAFGLLTTITEWKNINCSAGKKIFYTFTFPIFMFTYVPIAVAALFRKVEWKPITHNVTKSIEEVR